MKKSHLVFLFTILYLVVEFAFNAKVLDASGTNTSIDMIENIEFWGRLLLGVGLGLVLWKLIPTTRVLALVPIFLVTIPLSYFGQKALVNHIVDSTSGEYRREAVQLLRVASAIEKEYVTIKDSGIAIENWSSPDGRVFLSLFPLMISFDTEYKEKMLSQTMALAKLPLYKERNEQLRTCSDSGLCNEAPDDVLRALDQLKSEYQNYSDSMMLGAPAESAEDAWNSFREGLAERGINMYRPDKFQRKRELIALRAKGLRLTDDWLLHDKKQFVEAWVNANASRSQSVNNAASNLPLDRETNQRLPAGLSWKEFQAHPIIQDKIKSKMSKLDVPSPSDASFDLEYMASNWGEYTFKIALDNLESKILKELEAPDHAFLNQGEFSELGENAARQSIVPVIAIAFSLLGSLLNLTGLLITLIISCFRFTTGWILGASVISLISLILTFSVFLSQSNAITEFEHYHLMVDALAQQAPQWQIVLLDWTIRLEPGVYILGETLRETVLMGWDFD